MDLYCRDCKWEEYCGTEAMAERLRGAGMLRRNSDAAPAEMVELLKAVAGRTGCPNCGRVGLAWRDSPEEDADWPAASVCQACGKPIPAERLEAVPGAILCAECQHNEDRGISSGPADYCPRCGTVMTLRMARGAGITRYALVCPACGRKWT